MAKNRKLKVDMTGVESYTRCPEGEQLARVKKMEMGTVQGSGDDALKAVFEVIKGEGKGCQVFETFSLSEKALWKLKQFLTAIGVKADGKLSLDLDKLEGKTCILDVIHEEYNGQKRAKISAYLKPNNDSEEDEDEDEGEDDEDEDEDEEEVKPPKTSKKSAAKKTPAKKKAAPKKKAEATEDKAPETIVTADAPAEAVKAEATETKAEDKPAKAKKPAARKPRAKKEAPAEEKPADTVSEAKGE